MAKQRKVSEIRLDEPVVVGIEAKKGLVDNKIIEIEKAKQVQMPYGTYLYIRENESGRINGCEISLDGILETASGEAGKKAVIVPVVDDTETAKA